MGIPGSRLPQVLRAGFETRRQIRGDSRGRSVGCHRGYVRGSVWKCLCGRALRASSQKSRPLFEIAGALTPAFYCHTLLKHFVSVRPEFPPYTHHRKRKLFSYEPYPKKPFDLREKNLLLDGKI